MVIIKDTFKFDEQRQLNFEFIDDRKKKFKKKGDNLFLGKKTKNSEN